MTKSIILYIPTLEGGGAEKVFVKLANYFEKSGLLVILISAYGSTYKSLLNENIKVVQITDNKPFKSNKLNLLLRFMVMPILLTWVLQKEKTDFLLSTVHEANLISFYVHKFFRKKTKYFLRMANVYDDSTLPKVIKPFLKKAINQTDNLIANSPDTAQSYNNFIGTKLEINIIGNPAYISYLNNTTEISSNSNYLIAVGRLEAQKNYNLMLEAFSLVIKKYPDLKLFILGTGSLESEIISKIKSLNLVENVELKGFVENPSVFYRNATAFVLSSDFEGFGNVIVEAMSHGLPIVSTNCPGGPNYILNKSNLGELSELRKPYALSESILKVLNNQDNYSKEAIIERAKEFSIEAIGAKYLEVITAE